MPGPRDLIRSALERRGHEREVLLEIAKGLIACVISYPVAVWFLSSPMPAFAPITALLVIQVTLYRSLLTSIRYSSAVAAGIACAGLFGMTAGEDMLTLSAVVLVGLLIGRWRRLGSYGPQVAVAGLFVFSAGGANDSEYLLRLLATVVVGAAAGVTINAASAPLARFGDPAEAIDDLSSAIEQLLADIADNLRSDTPLTNTEQWRRSAANLNEFVRRARTEIDYEEESEYVNPRRLVLRRGKRTYFRQHRAAVSALDRAIDQLAAITRSLDYLANEDDDSDAPATVRPEFLTNYADLLDKIARTIRVFGASGGGTRDDVQDQLATADSQHADTIDRSSSEPANRRERDLYGALAIDAGRILEELRTAA